MKKEYVILQRSYRRGERPSWSLLRDEQGYPVTYPTAADAIIHVRRYLRAPFMLLDEGEYRVADFAILGPDGAVRRIER